MIKSNVIPIKFKDYRTYSFHDTFGTIQNITAPFNFDTLKRKPNQYADGLPEGCTAETSNDIASNEDAVVYDDVDFTYRNTLLMMNDAPYGSPCDVMVALNATVVYGVKNKAMSPTDALKNRRAPFFIVQKLGDYFDGLLSAMQVKQGCLSVATPWFPIFEQVGADGLIVSPQNFADLSQVSWHDWEACGMVVVNGEQRIICKSWQGENYGDKGYCYFNRAQINALLGTKGSGCFGQKHARPEDIQTVKMTIWQTILSYARLILSRAPTLIQIKALQTSIAPVVNDIVPPTPVSVPVAPVAPAPSVPAPVAVAPVSPISSSLAWADASGARLSVRKICDDMGLTYTRTLDPRVTDKEVICACVRQESDFNKNATHQNKDPKTGKVFSTDYGIVQVNDYYHIGPGKDFPSVQYVYDNPEACVRWMIRLAKAGKLSLWSSYTSGAYKQWLPL